MRHDRESLARVALQSSDRQRPRRSRNQPADRYHTCIGPHLGNESLILPCLSYLFDHLFSRRSAFFCVHPRLIFCINVVVEAPSTNGSEITFPPAASTSS